MKYLLIGGAGFLGSKMSHDLIDHDEEVIVYDKFLYTNRSAIPPTATLIDDCVSNIDKHISLFKDVDVVYYLAGPRLTDITIDAEIEDELSNLRLTLDVLNPNCRFIFTSSCSVYGKDGNEVDEYSALQITSKYSELKIRSEDLIKEYDNPNHRIVRLATLYGDGIVSRPDLMINSFLLDVCTKDEIVIFDGNSYRPHLYIQDAATILRVLGTHTYEEKVLNIGSKENTLTKLQLVDLLNSIFDKDCKPVEDNPIDSRNYRVSFQKLADIHPHMFYPLAESIKDTGNIVEKVTLSLNDIDPLTGYHIAPTASPSYYTEEENKFSLPKNWGYWNVFTEDFKLFDKSTIWSLTTPYNFHNRDVGYKTVQELKGGPHIHLVPIFDPDYFQKNEKLGLSCVKPEYISDFTTGKGKLVFMLTLEGYSGSNGNRDLEIIQTWINDFGIPGENVYYITGNLIADKRAKRKNITFNIIPHGEFDNWLPYQHIKRIPVKFNPTDDQYLYLAYARNPRYQRIKLCHDLLHYGLLDKGRVSLNTWPLQPNTTYSGMNSNTLKFLHAKTPIEIDRTLQYNLAGDITIPDYENTFISIVNETLTTSGTLFISEKTYKAIIVGHPFMILGNAGTLEYLRSLGYKTFSKWIDESYDLEQNFERRTRKLVGQIIKLNQRPLSELKQIREEMYEVVRHNQNLLVDSLVRKYDLDEETGYIGYSYKPLAKILKGIWNTVKEN